MFTISNLGWGWGVVCWGGSCLLREKVYKNPVILLFGFQVRNLLDLRTDVAPVSLPNDAAKHSRQIPK